MAICGVAGRGQSGLKTEVDLLDISHIKPGSKIENEMIRTGRLIYEK